MARSSPTPDEPSPSPLSPPNGDSPSLSASGTSTSSMIAELERFFEHSDALFGNLKEDVAAADGPLAKAGERHLKRLKEEYANMRKRVKHSQRKLSTSINEVRRKVITGNPSKRVRDFVKEAPVVQTIDKFSFTMGVTLMLAFQHVMLVLPGYFSLFYVALTIPLMGLRYYLYKRDKYQYFMIDFCYFVNWICVVTTFAPGLWNGKLLLIAFVMGNGPLAGAIVTWRNSLVFHSLDKVTSVYIHILPALVTYVWRWMPAEADTLREACGGETSCTLSWRDWFLYPLALYLVWQGFYLWFTEVLHRDVLNADSDLQTSLRYLSKSQGGVTTMTLRIARMVGIMGRHEQFDSKTVKTKLVFVGMQFFYTIIFMIPCKICFDSQLVHTSLLVAYAFFCVWNGASYYIHVFSKRYKEKFEKREEKSITDEPTGAIDAHADELLLREVQGLEEDEGVQ